VPDDETIIVREPAGLIIAKLMFPLPDKLAGTLVIAFPLANITPKDEAPRKHIGNAHSVATAFWSED
jgi:hypothetical protein